MVQKPGMRQESSFLDLDRTGIFLTGGSRNSGWFLSLGNATLRLSELGLSA